MDVSPRQLPVIRNGGFLQAQDDQILDPLHARCLVLDDGRETIAIVVVDSCMLPTPVCDRAKELASQATGIRSDRIMISATHCHSAPSVMEFCLGSGCDEAYREFLPGKIAEAIRLAHDRREPVRLGWVQLDASAFTKCRRWITRSDQWQMDPFDERTVHANMHPGYQNPNYVGPSGPADPWLSLLMVQRADGTPLAALANFSMHYFSGHSGVSADFCGRFAKVLEDQLGGEETTFVGIMSQGTSGDLWWGDYSRASSEKSFAEMNDYADGLAQLVLQAIADIEYHADLPLGMAERRLTMDRRVPDPQRLAWARRLNELRGDRLPENRPEVYAMQAVHLHENPTDEVVLQAIRIGDLGITGMPNEVYGLTGLKLKRRSPLALTFNVSLANGACGYIPPPEQHALGGYNTWPATTAGLEVAAEPKIVRNLLEMLEQIAEKPRKDYGESDTEFARHIGSTSPYAYWRLAEMEQGDAADATGNGRTLRHEGMVAYHLPGRTGERLNSVHDSHAVHLAGGKLVGENLELGESYSLQFSFLSGAPNDYRGTTAVLFTRGGDRLILTGTEHAAPGRLMFSDVIGNTELVSQQWHHVVFVRNGDFVQVFVDGQQDPELSLKTSRAEPTATVWIGGNAANSANLEGKLDEISVYDRALTSLEVRDLYRAAGGDRKAGSEPTDDNPSEPTPDSERKPGLDSAPLEPDASMNCIHVRDGYRIELVASEPLVLDPVAIDWGADGKLWVAEMADYPLGIDGQGKPGGRIRFLEDTDGDGKYDSAAVFLEDVSFPNGLMAWGRGVLVTAAPEIFYAEDTDGDGKADLREVLLSGFMEGNQQLRVNGLRWGLDNLVHCASGAHHAGFGAGNSIFSAKRSESVAVGSRDFRFDPSTGFLDPQSGPSQFGRVRNDFDDWFGVQNSWPLWHYVLQDHYLRRNAKAASIDARQYVRLPRMPEVYSAKPPQRRFHGFDHAGHYTSACGISIYRDELLFPRDQTHAFTCEPFHNLVQHHVLQDDGVSYTGQRADDGPIDFFASTDRWTRPVMSRTGPDGALWIVDMYRYMIEHPEWLPQEGQDALRPGYRAGEKYGRIYRVVRKDVEPRRVDPIQEMSPEQQVELLRHPNGIVRDLVHRTMLLSPETVPLVSLQKIAADPSLVPESKIQVLSLLAGVDGLDPQLLELAAGDRNAQVRRFAIRLTESLGGEQLPTLLTPLVDDPSPKVRLQLACSLGQWPDPKAGALLAKLAIREDNDAFMQAALVSSLPKHYAAFVDGVTPRLTTLPGPVLDALLLLGEDQPRQLSGLMTRICTVVAPASLDSDAAGHVATRWTAWLDALQTRGTSLAELAATHPELMAAVESVRHTTAAVRTKLQDDGDYRAEFLGWLGREPENLDEDIRLLADGLSNRLSAQTQAAVLARLGTIHRDTVADVLIQNSSGLLPATRSQLIQVLMGRWQWQLKLLDGMESGAIAEQDLSLAQRRALMDSKNNAVAAAAGKVLGQLADSPRNVIVAQYRHEVYVGDPARGQVVFEQNCAVCHPLDRNKRPVGPDLRALTSRSIDGLLQSILDPSQQVDPKFTSYVFVLQDGRSMTGVVVDEGPGALTVLDAEGRQQTLLRDSIDTVQRMGKSIMPEGFEQKINTNQMSDLIAFLQAL